MANINVRLSLAKTAKDMGKIKEQIVSYSGIDEKHAREIDNDATAIAEMGAEIASLARQAMGNRSAGGLRKGVRRALGFTRP